MCTAFSWKNGTHYFGRTLDLEYSYAEETVLTPRKYPLPFCHMGTMREHYAILGIAAAEQSFPLYYDAMNERGLCMAALRFPGYAAYFHQSGRDVLAPHEVIVWILGQCASVRQARTLLARAVIAPIPFSENYPLSPMHWILADAEECAVLEQTAEGLSVYKNPAGVLTNAPPFPMQLRRLAAFEGELPGSDASAARFIRAAETARCAGKGDGSDISRFFRILGSVFRVRTKEGETETLYTSAYDTAARTLYRTTADNHRITAVRMEESAAEGDVLLRAPLTRADDILWEQL